eukprot:6598015-Prymnesium_polylepis.1
MPTYGTRKQRWDALLPAIKETPLHMWRDDVMQQSVRVYEDRKSGRHLHELIKRRRLLTTPQLLSEALGAIVDNAEAQVAVDAPAAVAAATAGLEAPQVAAAAAAATAGLEATARLGTLRALRRLADASEMPPAAAVEQAVQAEAVAQGVFDALAVTATIQSDYASQAETSREFHATCATKERHNYLVTLIGYHSRQVRQPNMAVQRPNMVGAPSPAAQGPAAPLRIWAVQLREAAEQPLQSMSGIKKTPH